MEVIREKLKHPWAPVIGGFVVGLILGLFILGWWLFPVEWTDAAPGHLRQDLKIDYLRLAIDSYTLNPNAELAKARWNALGDQAGELLTQVEKDPQAQSLTAISAFQSLVKPKSEQTKLPQITPGTATGKAKTQTLLPVMCGITLVLALGLVVIYFIKKRAFNADDGGQELLADDENDGQGDKADFSSMGEDPPITQFMTTYMLGDDMFDDSFSIDSPTGEFLGECGVGISEPIGVGDPKKVTAFEVWVFDKNDIQTVTKVLMSEHAFLDEATKQRLAAKGEPVKADAGVEMILETESLQLVARVVDMSYGMSALPEKSFFDRITIELAVWPRTA